MSVQSLRNALRRRSSGTSLPMKTVKSEFDRKGIDVDTGGRMACNQLILGNGRSGEDQPQHQGGNTNLPRHGNLLCPRAG